jgi:hypothetical protein
VVYRKYHTWGYVARRTHFVTTSAAFNVPRRRQVYDRQLRSKDTEPWKNNSSKNSRRSQNSPSASRSWHNTYLRETRDRLIENFRSLETKIDQDLQDIRRRFNERIGQEIVKVTSDAIAEALTKRVLTVRTAQRGENVDVVIRQASPAEVRATKLF